MNQTFVFWRILDFKFNFIDAVNIFTNYKSIRWKNIIYIVEGKNETIELTVCVFYAEGSVWKQLPRKE